MHRERRYTWLWQILREGLETLGGSADDGSLCEWVQEKCPRLTEDLIRKAISSCTVNDQSRTYFRRNCRPRVADRPHDCLYRHADGLLISFDPKEHGEWQTVRQSDGQLLVCVASHYLAEDLSACPEGGDVVTSAADTSPPAPVRWLDRFLERTPERFDPIVVGVLKGFGILLSIPITLLLFLIAGGLSIPVALFAAYIPVSWHAAIGYGVASLCVAWSLVFTMRYVDLTWKGESRQELAGKTVWASFREFLLGFLWLTFVFGGSYWMLDRLLPGEHFGQSGAGLIDWLYFSLMTVATVGYGDISPSSWFTRCLTSVQVVEGLCLLGMFVGVLASLRAQEVHHGHPRAWRNFARMREDFLEVSKKFGARSPEAKASLIEFAQEVCLSLSLDEEFGQGFLNWLFADPYAKLDHYGVRQGGRIVGLGTPGGAFVDLIWECGGGESPWEGWTRTGICEVDKYGFLQLYKLSGMCIRDMDTGFEPVLVPDSGAEEVDVPAGYAPIGLGPLSIGNVGKAVWVSADTLASETFAERILGYVERYFVEIGHTRRSVLAQTHMM